MRLRFCLGLALILSVACTHAEKSPNRAYGSPTPILNSRLAQAQVTSVEGSSVQGTMNFEQMPNSLIVTYSLQGLKPKETYQILAKEDPSCDLESVTASGALYQLKANKQGSSEHTFKTEDFSVSGDRALMGKTIVVVATPNSGRSKIAARMVACGHVEAQKASGSSEGVSDESD